MFANWLGSVRGVGRGAVKGRLWVVPPHGAPPFHGPRRPTAAAGKSRGGG